MIHYNIELTGLSSLILHNDSIEWADKLLDYRSDPANKNKGVPGDDRSPPWTWIGDLYDNGKQVILPAANLMTMLRDGGAMIPKKKGKGSVSHKAVTQTGILILSEGWVIQGKKGPVDIAPILGLIGEMDFEKHKAAAESWGFTLYMKPVRIGTKRHIRVRPRFDGWKASGAIAVSDDSLTETLLQQILGYAGMYAGIGDYRPSSRGGRPGGFGRFSATIAQGKE